MSKDGMFCVECKRMFDADRSLYWTHDRVNDEWLCADCTKTYSRIAGEKIVKAIKELPELERLALGDTRLSGCEAIMQEIEDCDNDY